MAQTQFPTFADFAKSRRLTGPDDTPNREYFLTDDGRQISRPRGEHTSPTTVTPPVRDDHARTSPRPASAAAPTPAPSAPAAAAVGPSGVGGEIDLAEIIKDPQQMALRALRSLGVKLGSGISPSSQFLLSLAQRAAFGAQLDAMSGSQPYSPMGVMEALQGYLQKGPSAYLGGALGGRQQTARTLSDVAAQARQALSPDEGGAIIQRFTDQNPELGRLLSAIIADPRLAAQLALAQQGGSPFNPFGETYERYVTQFLPDAYEEGRDRSQMREGNFLEYLLQRGQRGGPFIP